MVCSAIHYWQFSKWWTNLITKNTYLGNVKSSSQRIIFHGRCLGFQFSCRVWWFSLGLRQFWPTLLGNSPISNWLATDLVHPTQISNNKSSNWYQVHHSPCPHFWSKIFARVYDSRMGLTKYWNVGDLTDPFDSCSAGRQAFSTRPADRPDQWPGRPFPSK